MERAEARHTRPLGHEPARRPIRRMMFRRAWVQALAAFFLCSFGVSSAGAGPPVAVISRDIRPYMLAVEGLEAGVGHSVRRVYVEDGGPRLLGELEDLAAGSSVFVAVGPQALEALAALPTVPPTVAVMIWDIPTSVATRMPHLRAITLQIPLADQLKVLTALFPNLQAVAVPVRPEQETTWLREGLSLMGDAMATRVRRIALKDRSNWSEIWTAGLPHPSAVLFRPDPALASPTVIRHVITQCLLRKILPVGYNAFFHEAGAGVSFVVDYEGIGRRAAVLLQRSRPDEGGVEPPPFRVWFKERSVRFVGLVPPDQDPPFVVVERRP